MNSKQSRTEISERINSGETLAHVDMRGNLWISYKDETGYVVVKLDNTPRRFARIDAYLDTMVNEFDFWSSGDHLRQYA